MEISLFLSKLFGIYFLIMSSALLFKKEYMKEVYNDFFNSAGLMALAGIINLFGGVIVLLFHHIWVLEWQVAITIIGYLMVLKGITRFWVPHLGKNQIKKLTKGNGFNYLGVVILLVGIWLTYKGFSVT